MMRALLAGPAPAPLVLRLRAAGARHGDPRPPPRVHRAHAPGLDLRRDRRHAARRLDQLRAAAGLRADVRARRHRHRRHGAHDAQPGAARGESPGAPRRSSPAKRRSSACCSTTARATTGRQCWCATWAAAPRWCSTSPPAPWSRRCWPVPAQRRGWMPLGRVMLETRFPLGLFRAWSYVRARRALPRLSAARAHAAAAAGRRAAPRAPRAPRPWGTTTFPACAATSCPIRRATWPGRLRRGPTTC